MIKEYLDETLVGDGLSGFKKWIYNHQLQIKHCLALSIPVTLVFCLMDGALFKYTWNDILLGVIIGHWVISFPLTCIFYALFLNRRMNKNE